MFSAERAKKTMVHIGPAVFSGGFSTFLAFLLLVNSISYGFTLFFRVTHDCHAHMADCTWHSKPFRVS